MEDQALLLKYQLCFRLYAASRQMTRLYQPILEPFGLTYPQYILLLVLFEHEQMDFKDLSRTMDLTTATLTPMVQKLEKQGLLFKIKNPEDSRRINVILSESGQALKAQLVKVPYTLADQLDMDIKHYETLTNELDLLLNKMQQLDT